jgi:hypothetical protein
VTNMITSLGWQSLEHRRHNSRLCMLYKIQHNLIDINKDLYIRHNDSRTLSWKRRFWPLVLLSLCLIYKSLLMSIRLCWILYSMHSEQSETGTSYQPAQLPQLPSRSLGLTLWLAPAVARHGPHVYNFNCKKHFHLLMIMSNHR